MSVVRTKVSHDMQYRGLVFDKINKCITLDAATFGEAWEEIERGADDSAKHFWSPPFLEEDEIVALLRDEVLDWGCELQKVVVINPQLWCPFPYAVVMAFFEAVAGRASTRPSEVEVVMVSCLSFPSFM